MLILHFSIFAAFFNDSHLRDVVVDNATIIVVVYRLIFANVRKSVVFVCCAFQMCGYAGSSKGVAWNCH